jgi:predicted glutamine amidotransferase
MCIIFYNEAGKAYDKDRLSVAYDNNPHGVGIMWVENGRTKTLRGLFSKSKMFEIVKEFEGVPHAMHLRWRTRGKIDKDLCHPFRASHKQADKQVYMMHNGTFLDIETPKDVSDTSIFAQKMQGVTKTYGTDMLFTESFLRRVEKDIKSYNKVIFLRDDGKVSIMNPDQWHIEDGIWMSNTYSFREGYRKESVLADLSRKVGFSSAQTETPPAPVAQGGGKSVDWFSRSIMWEQARAAAARSEKEKAELMEADPSLSKKDRKMARRERRRLERELAERDALEQMRSKDLSGRVVRRKRLDDGSCEIIPFAPRALS